jgi:hypothetical protein
VELASSIRRELVSYIRGQVENRPLQVGPQFIECDESPNSFPRHAPADWRRTVLVDW